MAIILKHVRESKDKGVILLSHRELSVFRLAKIFSPITFRRLISSYQFILHIGWFHRVFESPEWLSCVMTSPANIGNFDPNGVRFENICSRDVLPEVFCLDDNVEKQYDCTYICNNSKNKRAREYFELVQSMPNRKFLLILSYPEQPDPVKFDNSLVEEIKTYQRKFGAQSNLTFVDAQQGPQGYLLSREKIAEYLRVSRLYVHLCRREGESRSLGEALACGCFLAIHQDFVGGATDLCSDYNSVSFASRSDLIEKINNVLDRGISYSDNASEYGKIRKKTLLKLRQLLFDLGMTHKEIDSTYSQDLSMLLPGHIKSISAVGHSALNSDIVDANAFRSFCDFCDVSPFLLEIEALRVPLWMKTKGMKLVNFVKARKIF